MDYKHFKGTVYTKLGEVETNSKKEERVAMFDAMMLERATAKHHETLEDIPLWKEPSNKLYFAPDETKYVLYREKDDPDGVKWVREMDNFYDSWEEDGKKVYRFEKIEKEKEAPTQELRGQVKKEADLTIPNDMEEKVEKTFKRYKKWYDESQKELREIMAIEDEDEQKEALKKRRSAFHKTYAGVISKDTGERVTPKQLKKIWKRFMKEEYIPFLQAHTNLNISQIVDIGVDKFVYVLGWQDVTDVDSWRQNKIRIGVCCHCHDQFIPMMLQYNHGLCYNCKPHFSEKAIRKFMIRQLNIAPRYDQAQNDLLMDFYIIFYHDDKFRKMFLKDTETAASMEEMTDGVPEWAKKHGT